MFGVYEAYSCDNTPSLTQRAHFTTDFLAREWAELKAKKEFSNLTFVVINFTTGAVLHQFTGVRTPKNYSKEYNDLNNTVLTGKVDIQT